MDSPRTGPLRLVRTCVFAAVALLLGVGAHALAGGLPEPGVIALAIPVVVLAALGFTGRERRAAGLFVALGALQVFLHLFFAAAHAGAALATTGAAASGPCGHPGTLLLPSGADGQTVVPLGHGLLEATPPGMLVAHLAALALSAWALGRGERSLWGLARQVCPALPDAPRRPVIPARPVVAARLLVLQGALARSLVQVRGPPAVPLPA